MNLQDGIDRTLSLIMPGIEDHRRQCNFEGLRQQPFVLGLTGLQGSGKSTWAEGIVHLLRDRHKLNSVAISLDDLYKTHDDLLGVRERDSDNKLLQTRGQPGFFDAIRTAEDGEELCIPSFDKSRYAGAGDRAPLHTWKSVTGSVDVIVFEGWCLGFSPLSLPQLREKHQYAQERQSKQDVNAQMSTSTLADHALCHLERVNESLRGYCEAFTGPQQFQALVHIDTNDLVNVYEWRWQQEQALWDKTGCGMTKEQVYAFVRGYMPAYEMYLEHLRDGFFPKFEDGQQDRCEIKIKTQIRVLLDRQRIVQSIEAVS
ncbi:hypothetical protein E4T38_06093 [Aureobasidium subglaciale]|nr:hypothetical protein E4T38_06093 [Aureobasidium subglaciale]KAI5220084.1 hypothetical protein E4T40_06114 [Aureobasidium subglaciale]KAI5224025.1 hypothetical protein E4T41_05954 [Aureobasidium subglaciale]KAI5260620.1 hypothetical protein E4T46_05848 [Aureobasidium subglaciale]